MYITHQINSMTESDLHIELNLTSNFNFTHSNIARYQNTKTSKLKMEMDRLQSRSKEKEKSVPGVPSREGSKQNRKPERVCWRGPSSTPWTPGATSSAASDAASSILSKRNKGKKITLFFSFQASRDQKERKGWFGGCSCSGEDERPTTERIDEEDRWRKRRRATARENRARLEVDTVGLLPSNINACAVGFFFFLLFFNKK